MINYEAMREAERGHVVVSVVMVKPNESRVHVYGPYTKIDARREERKMMDRARAEGYDHKLNLHVRKMIDIERTNRDR